MVLEGYKHKAIQSILGVSSGFISKWKKAFFKQGVEGLKLAYKGSQEFLNWDGASYHKAQQVRDYLDSVNHELEPNEWLITCELFAPNAPQQNPVEDIWLQAKRMIREFYFLCRSFSVVKRLFELCIHRQIFDFPKLHEYGVFS